MSIVNSNPRLLANSNTLPARSDSSPGGVDGRGMWQLMGDSLRGPRGSLVKLALAKGALFTVVGIICAVNAFSATDIRSVVLWSLGVIWAIAVVVTVKLWWWMEINRESVIRSVSGLGQQHDDAAKAGFHQAKPNM